MPGYAYHDLPRTNTVAAVNLTVLGDCLERFYLGYVLPDDATDVVLDDDDLALGIAKAAGGCVDNGLLDDLASTLGERPGSNAAGDRRGHGVLAMT